MRHLLSLRHSVLGAVLCSLLAACGGGGGGDAGAAAGGGGGGSTATVGSRSVPGFTVRATRPTPLVAGQPCTIQLSIVPDAGQPAVQTLAGWLGTDTYAAPGSTIAATPVSGLADTWQVVVTVPNPLPANATVWIRITATDGSIMEVGRSAFELAEIPAG